MKYFYDTEFLEGTQKSFFGQSKPTIDLISIGIVAEDGREYYAISKDFNLKEAWNRHDLITNEYTKGFGYEKEYETEKVYWIRENVLKPIYYDWVGKDVNFHEVEHFTYKNFKRLLKKYGKTNRQIAEEIIEFTKCGCKKGIQQAYDHYNSDGICNNNPQFYAYYADYDWVAFCWLFGKMIDLPKGFPMYTIDLKQSFDEKAESFTTKQLTDFQYGEGYMKHDVYEPLNYMKVDYTKIDLLKEHKNYPKQTNEHNSLSDAVFVKNLYQFLNTL